MKPLRCERRYSEHICPVPSTQVKRILLRLHPTQNKLTTRCFGPRAESQEATPTGTAPTGTQSTKPVVCTACLCLPKTPTDALSQAKHATTDATSRCKRVMHERQNAVADTLSDSRSYTPLHGLRTAMAQPSALASVKSTQANTAPKAAHTVP